MKNLIGKHVKFFKFFFAIFAFLISSITFAQDIPAFQGNFLNLSKAPINGGSIVAAIEDLRLNAGADVAVLVVDSTKPMEIEQYSIKLAEKWKIGKEKQDNGVIIVVAINDKATRLEVGYGLEGKLTDAITSRIIKEYMIPKFKHSDWEGGILEAMGRSKNILTSKKLTDSYMLNSGGVASKPMTNSSGSSLLSSANNVDGDVAMLLLLVAGVALLFTTKIGKIILLGIVIGSILNAVGSKLPGLIKGAIGGATAGAGAYYFSAEMGGIIAASVAGFIFGAIGIVTILQFIFSILGSIGGGSGGGSSSGGSNSSGDSSSSGGGGFGGGGSSGKW